MTYQTIPTIVIVGGGAGGLELATGLGHKLGKKQRANVVLVDEKLTHVWKPLLHEVAAGSFDSNVNETSFRAHASAHYFEFQQGRLSALSRADKRITLAPLLNELGDVLVPERQIAYDYLVIAVGSTTNDFGVPGVEANCKRLDNLDQAKAFHQHLLNLFLKKNYQTDTAPDIHVAIIGAGATGVELAAELRHAANALAAYGLHRIRSANVHLTLVEASDRILPALPMKVSVGVDSQLDRLGISARLKTQVTEVQPGQLCFADGTTLPADMLVWAAGIRAPKVLSTLDGLETNRIHQLVVKQNLQTTVDDAIFAFGDCAACPQPGTDQLVPARAQAAHQQADTLVRSLARLLNGGVPEDYIYRDYGSLISLSSDSAVGKLMGNVFGGKLFIEGKLARMFYVSLYRMHQLALHGVIRTGLYWLNDVFNRVLRPRLKLH